jgi:D-amino-acid dehydrogenase
VRRGGETEVLVIGGGVVGTSCAYYLAQAGREVTLIEREDSICPVEASSYGNAGLIMPSDVYPVPVPGVLARGLTWLLDDSSPLYIKPRLDPRLARWLLLFAARRRTRWTTSDRRRRRMASSSCPVQWVLDDAPYFWFDGISSWTRKISHPSRA